MKGQLFFNKIEKRYYYVGNPICDSCGDDIFAVAKITIIRKFKRDCLDSSCLDSSYNIVCAENIDCFNKISKLIHSKDIQEIIFAIITDEAPSGSHIISLKHLALLEYNGAGSTTLSSSDPKHNEGVNCNYEKAWRSMRSEYTWEGMTALNKKNGVEFISPEEQKKKALSHDEEIETPNQALELLYRFKDESEDQTLLETEKETPRLLN